MLFTAGLVTYACSKMGFNQPTSLIAGTVLGLGFTLFNSANRAQRRQPPNPASDKRQLVLFFDVNDTMYIGNSAKGVDKELAISKLLAEHYEDVWDAAISRIKMSYRNFIDTYKVPGDKRQPAIKKERHRLYKDFIDFLNECDHPRYHEIRAQYLKIKNNLKEGHIPYSFINLLQYLERQNFRYTIVFRTFGEDIKEVEAELARRTPLINLAHAKFTEEGLELSSGKVLKTRSQLLEHIKPFQHQAWQDNFDLWHDSGETYEGGKPYPFNEEHASIDTIFFDDNVDKRILRVDLQDDKELNQQFDQKTTQRLLARKGFIAPVDTFEACVSDNYFIEQVETLCAHRKYQPPRPQEKEVAEGTLRRVMWPAF
jgi:hypothetical protein